MRGIRLSRKMAIMRFKKILLIMASLVLAWGGIRLYYNLTDDFRMGNLTHEMPHRPEWDLTPLSAEDQAFVNRVLSKKFVYLAKGSQAYAFESDDGQYILKLFKFKHLKPSWLVTWLPSFPGMERVQKAEIARKEERCRKVFASYKLVYEKYRKESCLLFMQLNSPHQPRPITVLDKLGFERKVDLGEVVFVLQEKATPVRQELKELLNKHQVELAKHRIGQILAMCLREYHQGVYDNDTGLINNAGFVGDRPVHFDAGKFVENTNMKDPKNFETNLTSVAGRIAYWLYRAYPEHYPDIALDMEAHLSEAFGHPYAFPKGAALSQFSCHHLKVCEE